MGADSLSFFISPSPLIIARMVPSYYRHPINTLKKKKWIYDPWLAPPPAPPSGLTSKPWLWLSRGLKPRISHQRQEGLGISFMSSLLWDSGSPKHILLCPVSPPTLHSPACLRVPHPHFINEGPGARTSSKSCSWTGGVNCVTPSTLIFLLTEWQPRRQSWKL